MRERLLERLAIAGISPDDVTRRRRAPWDVWLELEHHWGGRITLVDLYDLEAAARGVSIEELPAADRRTMALQSLAVQFPGWQPVPSAGFRGEPVEVTPYDEKWPEIFLAWRDRLTDGLGDRALRIDHVGSTAVPGLDAKPVIDIQVSVDDLGNEARYVPDIEATGVQLQARDDAHRYFRPPRGEPRAVQVHVCPARSAWERDHLLFRDYLRSHAEARAGYAELKRELAREWHCDRLAYNAEKTAFILHALTEAERWAAGAGWTVTSS